MKEEKKCYKMVYLRKRNNVFFHLKNSFKKCSRTFAPPCRKAEKGVDYSALVAGLLLILVGLTLALTPRRSSVIQDVGAYFVIIEYCEIESHLHIIIT